MAENRMRIAGQNRPADFAFAGSRPPLKSFTAAIP